MIKKYFKWFFRVIAENFEYKKLQKFSNTLFMTSSDDLTIMTFNIRRDCIEDENYNWQYRKENIIKMIKQYSPDIICMQEVMPHMAKYLIYQLGNYYDSVGLESFTCGDLTRSWCFFGEGLLTFYKKNKFTLKSTDCIKLFDGRKINIRRASVLKLFDSKENTYDIINIHFCHKDRYCRKQSFEKILKYINDRNITNAFIAGDFNCEPSWPNNGVELFLNNFYHNMPDKKGSINNFKESDNNITIDFVFSNKHLIKSEVIRDQYDIKYLSDHYPILCHYN